VYAADPEMHRASCFRNFDGVLSMCWPLNLFVFMPAMLQVWFSTCNLHLRRFAGRFQLRLGSTLYSASTAGKFM
jgi:hypothetical protein